jgi:hypothetical protein
MTFKIKTMRSILILVFLFFSFSISLVAQNFSEILGRPTNSSVTLSVLFDQPVEIQVKYGTVPGSYPFSTPVIPVLKDIPNEAELTGLSPDTRYYYQTWYRISGSGGEYQKGAEHTFQTQRPAGKSFSFAVEADPHLDSNTIPAAYNLTLQNILAKKPDFMLDMGDNFMSEKLPVINQGTITERHLLYRPCFGSVCHSVPLFLVLGNHEGELGWRRDGTASCLPIMAANTRNLYYPNPAPDAFYSGNTRTEEFINGRLRNYYAWEWGNALFIVLDPYWYTTKKPGWGWTLGPDQYQWFRQTITGSQAKFKFIFCHQLVGGNGNDGRGGAEFAGLYEMGGQNNDSTWGFEVNRPGWGKTIHQLMVENGGNIFFHGHDHFFGKQEKGGVIYQELPQPSSKNISNANQAAAYGYVSGDFLPSRGFVLVTVTDSTATVDYIRTYLPNEETAQHKNGEVAYSYTIRKTHMGLNEQTAVPDLLVRQNVPNPFHGETRVDYQLANCARVKVEILDIFGNPIVNLADDYQCHGAYSVALDRNTLSLSDGLYYCRISAGPEVKTIKMIIKK